MMELAAEESLKPPAIPNCAEDIDQAGVIDGCSISVFPSYIRFPHDQPSKRTVKVTVWNKTRHFLEIILEPMTSGTFRTVATSNNLGTYGGSEITFWIKCESGNEKIACDALTIRVKGADEVVTLPVQLFPGMAWFCLPKCIVMPPVSIGNMREMTIPLPNVPDEETFYATFSQVETNQYNAFEIIPSSGVIGGPDGVTELTVQYIPTEYVTFVQKLQIHFPGVSETPYEITFHARAVPGLESAQLLNEVACIKAFMQNEMKVQLPKIGEPKLKFAEKTNEASVEELEDVFTPAGVMHFLLKKDSNEHESAKSVGPLGITMAEEQKIYKGMEADFKHALNKTKIHQKNILHQKNVAYPGSDPLSQKSREMIIKQRDDARKEYEVKIGDSVKDTDASRTTKLKVKNQRSIRHFGEQLPRVPVLSDEEITKIHEEGSKVTKKKILTRFIQAVYKVMTRYRVSKRLPKIRTLIQNIKKQRLKERTRLGNSY